MPSPNDEIQVPSSGDLTFGPDRTVFHLRLPLEARNLNAKSTFKLSCKEPAYDLTLTMEDDEVPGDEFVELLFPDVWTRGKYTLEVDPKNGKPKYTVFKDKKISELPGRVPGSNPTGTAASSAGAEPDSSPGESETA